jgi:GTP-binding protein LepA
MQALAGYAEAKPMVWCGMFPTDAADYDSLRDSLGKLKLNDAALQFEPENSAAMGFGFRCRLFGVCV